MTLTMLFEIFLAGVLLGLFNTRIRTLVQAIILVALLTLILTWNTAAWAVFVFLVTAPVFLQAGYFVGLVLLTLASNTSKRP